jgi:hypothetical protein
MQPRFGLYLLLAAVSVMAVIFAAVRAWGPIGIVPLILAALAAWMIRAGLHFERDFESGAMSFVGIMFALASLLSFVLLMTYSP